LIEDVLGLRVNPDYFQYLRHKLERIAPARQPLATLRASAGRRKTKSHACGVDEAR
jgi:hypothetical protein